ncbi:MAG: hypothetical protein KatS3mg002_0895 [Candidatus Woesearchaeota archaeon]|nr:MAG: hypothetical protein KatS3mg002_0895 [Candidatus Woesearchaeota archaeon]
MMKKRGIGQSWSLDIILAFVIFMLIVGIFYTLLTKDSKKDKIGNSQIEATFLSGSLDASSGTTSSLTIIEDGVINKEKLKQLYSENYTEIKKKFGINGDFCIYIVDQYGNLIVVDTNSGTRNGFGNGNLTINDKPCGSIVS